MDDLVARTKDAAERLDRITAEIRYHENAREYDVKRVDELLKQWRQVKAEIADLIAADPRSDMPTSPAGSTSDPSRDTSLDYPEISVPDANTYTYTFDEEPAERPRTQEKPGTGRPRTQEKPGTGTVDPEPEHGTLTIDDVADFDAFPAPPPDRPRTQEKFGTGRPLIVFGAGFVALSLAAVFFVVPGLARPSEVSAPASPTIASPIIAAPAPPAPTAGPIAVSAASAGYRCVGDQLKLYDNSNGALVSGGGGPSTFSTNGKAYCLVSVSTYHWNGGKGATPGRVGLIGGAGSVGPVQTKSGTGVPNADWVYVPEADARPLLMGDYTCTDSDPTTWSRNDASSGRGFCRVWVQNAEK